VNDYLEYFAKIMGSDPYEVSPCLGCGYCCKESQCISSYNKHGFKVRCPDLSFHDGRYWCGLIENSSPLEVVQYTDALSIGAGCCSTLNSDRMEMERQKK